MSYEDLRKVVADRSSTRAVGERKKKKQEEMGIKELDDLCGISFFSLRLSGTHSLFKKQFLLMAFVLDGTDAGEGRKQEGNGGKRKVCLTDRLNF